MLRNLTDHVITSFLAFGMLRNLTNCVTMLSFDFRHVTEFRGLCNNAPFLFPACYVTSRMVQQWMQNPKNSNPKTQKRKRKSKSKGRKKNPIVNQVQRLWHESKGNRALTDSMSIEVRNTWTGSELDSTRSTRVGACKKMRKKKYYGKWNEIRIKKRKKKAKK